MLQDQCDKDTWRDDPALKVTCLSENHSDCEVTISLSQDIKRDIQEPGPAGLYKADGSYLNGRPVLRHEGGSITLSAVQSWFVRGDLYEYLDSGSAPSQCPADPRAARNERIGLTHWRYKTRTYKNKLGGWRESSGISIKCKTHLY